MTSSCRRACCRFDSSVPENVSEREPAVRADDEDGDATAAAAVATDEGENDDGVTVVVEDAGDGGKAVGEEDEEAPVDDKGVGSAGVHGAIGAMAVRVGGLRAISCRSGGGDGGGDGGAEVRSSCCCRSVARMGPSAGGSSACGCDGGTVARKPARPVPEARL